MPVQVVGMKFATREEVQKVLENEGLRVASIPRRASALAIDIALIVLVSRLIILVCGKSFWNAVTLGSNGSETFLLFAFWICTPFYHVILVSLLGRTIGCLVAKTDVIRMSGQRIGAITAFIRGALFGLTLGIRFPLTIILHTVVMVATIRGNPFRLTAWDLLAQTIVVQKEKAEDSSLKNKV